MQQNPLFLTPPSRDYSNGLRLLGPYDSLR